MNIRNRKELKHFAAERLENVKDSKRIVLIYTGLIMGLSVLVMAVNYVLDLRMDQLGGLSNMSARAALSALQGVLPLVQSMVSTCLSVGFLAAMLRIARGQYVSPQTLRLGFDRFWVLLRCTVIKGLLYTSGIFVSVYAGIMVYMMTPWASEMMEFLVPYLEDVPLIDATVVLETAVYDQFAAMLWPAYLICGILAAVLLLPMVYSYRMAEYVIIDKPAYGAMMALRESKKMMRANRAALFKLDVSLWWYYGALTLASVLGYGDVILPLLGLELPFSAEVGYFLFYGLYLAATAVAYYFLLDRVDVTYALAYDTLKPEEPKNEGVVLGNIFQM